MGRGFRQTRNSNRCDTSRVEKNGRVVEVFQNVYAEGVDRAMRYQKRSVNPNCPPSSRHIVCLDCCQSGDQSCLAKGDTCCNGDLAQ